jgi:copper ion binding protein
MYELQVEGMSCNHCISKVTGSVKKVDDAAKVDIDLATKKVRVESTADLDDVCEAITEAGYPAKASNVA